jgi:hypothetical protein
MIISPRWIAKLAQHVGIETSVTSRSIIDRKMTT